MKNNPWDFEFKSLFVFRVVSWVVNWVACILGLFVTIGCICTNFVSFLYINMVLIKNWVVSFKTRITEGLLLTGIIYLWNRGCFDWVWGL